MAKRKRKRARKKTSNPKRSHARKRRRSAVARKRTHARRRTSSPKRSHARRRLSKRNPSSHFKKKRHGGRARRRNPGGMLGQIAMALLAGVAGFAGTFAISYAVTPAADMVTNGQRNRALVGAAIGAGGAYLLRKKHPIAAGGIALGALLGAVGGWITLKTLAALPPKTPAQMAAVYGDNMQAVYGDNMQGIGSPYPVLGAFQPIGAYDQIGDLGVNPPAPWNTGTPFDGRGY